MTLGRNVIRRILVGGGMLAASGLLVASTGLSGAGAGAAARDAPVIALVNEDEPASFNDESYVFGRDFVSLVAGDDRYDWEVVSRGVAEKAFADEAVSAVIVLPRSFSHDILTLQDLNPLKAVIDYKVVPGDSLTRQRLQNEVSSILREFNSRVVKMYFASVAGNISSAQVNMDSVVGGQSRLVEALSSDFQPSVEKVGERQKSSLSLSEILRQMNSGWIAAQNSFTAGATGALTSTSTALAGRQPALADYFTLQEQLARTNIANGNGAIGAQGSSDKNFYDRAFADHVTSLLTGDGTWSGIAGLSSTDADGNPTGVLATLTDSVDGYNRLAVDYNARIAALLASLDQQRIALDGSRQGLENLEKQLLHEYFDVDLPADDGNYDVELGLLTEVMARTALAHKLSDTFAADGSAASTAKKYQDRIDTLLRQVATDPAQYEPVFEAMKAADADFVPGPYLEQLRVIQKYNEARGFVAPALTVARAPQGTTRQTVTTTLPVTAGAGERVLVAAALPAQLPAAGVTVAVAAPPACPPTTPNCVALDQAANTVTIDNTAGTEALPLAVTYSLDLNGVSGPVTAVYTAQNVAPTPAAAPRELASNTHLLASPSTSATSAAGELSSTVTYLGTIQTAANLLQFLYGSPDDTADSFHDAVLANGDFEGRSEESVFKRYGRIGAGTIEQALSLTDVRAYQKLGHDNIAAIVAQISLVRKQLDSIAANTAVLSGLHLSDTYFSDALHQLDSWYAAAMTSVNASPERWNSASNDVIQLATVPWSGQKEGRAELYLDDRTGPGLYQSLTNLVQATSRDAQSIASSAQTIADNSDQFDALMAGVQSTQTDTQAVLDAMKGTITTGSADLASGSEFSKRFATVLSNTRASGVDPASIYEHFANPVTVKDQTPTAGPAAGEPFDYRWIAIFAAGSLIGALLVMLAQLAARRRSARAGR